MKRCGDRRRGNARAVRAGAGARGAERRRGASGRECGVAPRLGRALCAHCKRRTILPAGTLREYGYHAGFDSEGYEPVGCKHSSLKETRRPSRSTDTSGVPPSPRLTGFAPSGRGTECR